VIPGAKGAGTPGRVMTADADDMETLQARLDGQSRLDQAAQQ
jgi:hypothetical protein